MGHLGLKLLYSCSHRLLLGLANRTCPMRCWGQPEPPPPGLEPLTSQGCSPQAPSLQGLCLYVLVGTRPTSLPVASPGPNSIQHAL